MRRAGFCRKNTMKWIAPIAHGLGILLTVSLLKNAAWFWRSLAYARDFSDGYGASGTLICICGILALAIWVIVALFRRPSLRSLARVTGLLLALDIPSYAWPEVAWKLEINASRYDELISRSKSEPKLVILEERESQLSINGIIETWIIYDESDQIELPHNLRSESWRKVAPPELLGGVCPTRVSKIKYHYFHVILDCT